MGRFSLTGELEVLGMAAEDRLYGAEVAWVRGAEVMGMVHSPVPRFRTRRGRFGSSRSHLGWGGGTSQRGRGPGRRGGAAQASPGSSGMKDVEHYGKFAVGLWGNGSTFQVPQAGSPTPAVREGSWGAYLLAERTLGIGRDDPRGAHGFHLRLGLADGETEEIDRYAGVGIVSSRPLAGRGSHQVGMAVSAARLSRPWADLMGVTESARRWEVAFEITWRVETLPWIALQPDLQYVLHPGSDPAREDALVVGFRLEVTPGRR